MWIVVCWSYFPFKSPASVIIKRENMQVARLKYWHCAKYASHRHQPAFVSPWWQFL